LLLRFQIGSSLYLFLMPATHAQENVPETYASRLVQETCTCVGPSFTSFFWYRFLERVSPAKFSCTDSSVYRASVIILPALLRLGFSTAIH